MLKTWNWWLCYHVSCFQLLPSLKHESTYLIFLDKSFYYLPCCRIKAKLKYDLIWPIWFVPLSLSSLSFVITPFILKGLALLRFSLLLVLAMFLPHLQEVLHAVIFAWNTHPPLYEANSQLTIQSQPNCYLCPSFFFFWIPKSWVLFFNQTKQVNFWPWKKWTGWCDRVQEVNWDG